MALKKYIIYILECNNGSFYTGYTTNLERRYKEHLVGTSKCKYTRSFPPIKVAAYWSFESDVSLILKIEKKIKSLSKIGKIKLIKNPNMICHLKETL